MGPSERNRNANHQKSEQYSGKFQWIILAFAAMNVIFLGGKRRAFGSFVSELNVEYNGTITLAELNWIGDSYAAVGYLTTSISSTMILRCNRSFKRFQLLGALFILVACLSSAYVPNPHWLFLTHTVLHGIGSSLILSVVGLVVNEHFGKDHPYHLLATTLVSGGSVASIVFVQTYALIIESYGWRNAFVILGILYFVVIASGAFVFKKNKSLMNYKYGKCSLDFQHHVNKRTVPLILLWVVDRVLTSIVTYGLLLNLTDSERKKGKTLHLSTITTTLFAAGEASTYIIGAIFTAVTVTLLKNRLKYILILCTFFMAIFLYSWEFLAKDNISLTYFLSFATGFCLGPSISFLFPAGEEMTTLPGHMAYPLSLGGMGLGMSLSPTFSAIIAEAFQYKWFFMVQGILMSAKCFCLIVATILLRYISHTESRSGKVFEENSFKGTDREALIKDMQEISENDISSRRFNSNVSDDINSEVFVATPNSNFSSNSNNVNIISESMGIVKDFRLRS